MIIIKTKRGDIFVNEKETVTVTHNRDERIVDICKGSEKECIGFVESVTYINDKSGSEWEDNGSHVAQLQRQLADIKTALQCYYKMSEQLENQLRTFACNMINKMQTYADKIPEDLAKNISDDGYRMKNIANDKTWIYREELIKAYKVVEASEADITDSLHKTIDEQAVVIRELKDQIKRMEHNEMMREEFQTEDKKPWWYRLVSWLD